MITVLVTMMKYRSLRRFMLLRREERFYPESDAVHRLEPSAVFTIRQFHGARPNKPNESLDTESAHTIRDLGVQELGHDPQICISHSCNCDDPWQRGRCTFKRRWGQRSDMSQVVIKLSSFKSDL